MRAHKLHTHHQEGERLHGSNNAILSTDLSFCGHGVHNLKKGPLFLALSQVEPELKIRRNRTFSFDSGCVETQELRKEDYNFEDDETGESWTCLWKESLGAGGTGNVYLGEYGIEDEPVAVKFIHCANEVCTCCVLLLLLLLLTPVPATNTPPFVQAMPVFGELFLPNRELDFIWRVLWRKLPVGMCMEQLGGAPCPLDGRVEDHAHVFKKCFFPYFSCLTQYGGPVAGVVGGTAGGPQSSVARRAGAQARQAPAS